MRRCTGGSGIGRGGGAAAPRGAAWSGVRSAGGSVRRCTDWSSVGRGAAALRRCKTCSSVGCGGAAGRRCAIWSGAGCGGVACRRCKACSGAGRGGAAGRCRKPWSEDDGGGGAAVRCGTPWPGVGWGGAAWRRGAIRGSTASRSSRLRALRDGASFCPISRASSTRGSDPGCRAAGAPARVVSEAGGAAFVLTRRYRSSAMPVLHRFRSATRVRLACSSTTGVRVRPRWFLHRLIASRSAHRPRAAQAPRREP